MIQSLPILYSFRRCPYAMRARLALYSAKIPHEHREVDLKNKPAEMLAVSPKGTVPVLQLADGMVLEQSLDIMKWALNQSPLTLEETQLITENDTVFKQALDRYKYYKPDRDPEETPIHNLEHCEAFLRKLETLLHPFLTGNTAILADMALFPFIRQFAMVDPGWFEEQPYPRLKSWLDFFLISALFRHVMQDYVPWTAGDQPTLIQF